MIILDPKNSANKKNSHFMDILSSLYTSKSPISSAHYFKIKGNNTLGKVRISRSFLPKLTR